MKQGSATEMKCTQSYIRRGLSLTHSGEFISVGVEGPYMSQGPVYQAHTELKDKKCSFCTAIV